MRFKTMFVYGVVVVLFLSAAGSRHENKTATMAMEDGSVPAITEYSATLPLDKIKLPAGFKIEIYAEVNNARSLAISPSGTLFVGNRNGDAVYAVKDTD